MLAQEIIKRKRDGEELANEEIAWFISEIVKDGISDSQIAAFAMATFLKGMSIAERISLTESMCNSGRRLTWDVSGPVIDKHSTGGVGDCVSLLLAPSLVACGGFVPMVSGRGLGHTGGTLDKLDSIPGYNTTPDLELFQNTVATAGCAIAGQTQEIAPADKRLYSVRDVTATIDSIDLITSSILSKKLSAGLDALILDIKCGNGAFMISRKKAKDLAKSLLGVGNGLGVKTNAIITDMNEPLSSSVGNSLEVLKVVNILKGNAKEDRLLEVVCALGGTILSEVGLANNYSDGFDQIRKTFCKGQSAEIFEKMVFSLGGSSNFLSEVNGQLPKAPFVEDVHIVSEGYVTKVDTRAVGLGLLALGGARRRSDDRIDYAVGFENLVALEDWVDSQVPLTRIHARDEKSLEVAKSIIEKAYRIGERKMTRKNPTIIEQISNG